MKKYLAFFEVERTKYSEHVDDVVDFGDMM
jgi:hypothetical protein